MRRTGSLYPCRKTESSTCNHRLRHQGQEDMIGGYLILDTECVEMQDATATDRSCAAFRCCFEILLCHVEMFDVSSWEQRQEIAKEQDTCTASQWIRFRIGTQWKHNRALCKEPSVLRALSMLGSHAFVVEIVFKTVQGRCSDAVVRFLPFQHSRLRLSTRTCSADRHR